VIVLELGPSPNGVGTVLQERAAAVLWNLSVRNPRNEMAIVSAGGVPGLVRLLREGSPAAKAHAAGAIANLVEGCLPAKAAVIEKGGAEDLWAILHSSGDLNDSRDATLARERAAAALARLGPPGSLVAVGVKTASR